jgi:hypothetical protein
MDVVHLNQKQLAARWSISEAIIYKIDRLTRSLADFSKMVEVFERYGVSFVSVTQQFNTTTSMGRLMLNILLSFAQFEREVTCLGRRLRHCSNWRRAASPALHSPWLQPRTHSITQMPSAASA